MATAIFVTGIFISNTINPEYFNAHISPSNIIVLLVLFVFYDILILGKK